MTGFIDTRHLVFGLHLCVVCSGECVVCAAGAWLPAQAPNCLLDDREETNCPKLIIHFSWAGIGLRFLDNTFQQLSTSGRVEMAQEFGLTLF